jgi:hypothetical protein
MGIAPPDMLNVEFFAGPSDTSSLPAETDPDDIPI